FRACLRMLLRAAGMLLSKGARITLDVIHFTNRSMGRNLSFLSRKRSPLGDVGERPKSYKLSKPNSSPFVALRSSREAKELSWVDFTMIVGVKSSTMGSLLVQRQGLVVGLSSH
ncbi:hypothetical protein Tco_0101280, partial [Tanacetum coccineum]